MHKAGLMPPGTVMGHEFAGVVAQRGEGVDGLAEGQRVSVLPSVQCGGCDRCREGRGELCPTQGPTSIGLGANDGAYAEFVRVAAASCFPLPDGMDGTRGALVEPYAVGLHAVRRSRAAGDPTALVGIIGAGPIGLMTLAALHRQGVENVVVAERSETRAAVAERMGASAVVADATRLDQPFGEAPEVVFECAGSGTTGALALQLARAGGEVVLVGVADPDDPITLMSVLWVVKEVDYKPSIGYSAADFGDAVDAVAAGAVDPAVMVSDTRPLEDAERSFADLATPGGPVKLLLAP
jgi:(R,R)-butanediol dehydrogenase/meso-butanediol dehydrogenase/diacetyl reductase